MKLFSIIHKNFRIFIRSKMSALIIFLGPLLLVSLVGLSFSNTHLSGLNTGVYAENYNEMTNSIISKIQENKFTVTKYDSNESCSNAVKKGDAGICLLFPKNMDKTNNEVTFVIDYSKINLVWIVLDIFSNKISERSTELRYNYATDLLNRVNQTKSDLTKQSGGLTAMSGNQKEASASVESAQEGLDSMNTNVQFTTITSAEVMSSLNAISTAFENAKSELTSAKSKVSSSGLSELEQEAINSDLTSAESSLSGARLYLKGNSSLNSLEYMVGQLQISIASAQAAISSVSAQKQAVSGDITYLQSNIEETQKTLDNLNKTVSNMLSRLENVKDSDAEQLVSPIKTKIDAVTTEETHFNYLFPTLIVLIIMITSVLLSSTLVMAEKKSKSLFRNFITPTSDFIFNAGIFLTTFIAIGIQLLIFLVVSAFFFDVNVLGTISYILVALPIIISVFVLLGMIIGYVFKSEESYVLAAITVSTILLFLSSTIMPIESISSSVRTFASVTPFVLSETMLRQIMFFDFGLSGVLSLICILLGYVAVFVGVIFGVQKLAREHISFIRKKDKK